MLSSMKLDPVGWFMLAYTKWKTGLGNHLPNVSSAFKTVSKIIQFLSLSQLLFSSLVPDRAPLCEHDWVYFEWVCSDNNNIPRNNISIYCRSNVNVLHRTVRIVCKIKYTGKNPWNLIYSPDMHFKAIIHFRYRKEGKKNHRFTNNLH